MNPSDSKTNQTIDALRQAAHENEVFAQIFRVLAERKRSRNIMTLSGLTQRMTLANLHYSVEDYRAFIKLLGDLELGTVLLDKYGEPRAIKDLRVSLQSIGMVALDASAPHLRSWKPRNRFTDIEAGKPIPPLPAREQPKAATHLLNNYGGKLPKVGHELESMKRPQSGFEGSPSTQGGIATPMSLAFTVNDKVIEVKVPQGTSMQDIAELIKRMSS